MADNKAIREETVFKEVKVDLSDEEKAQRSASMARAHKTIKDLKALRKEFQTELKGKIESQENIISSCADALNLGFEFKEVECVVAYDFVHSRMTITRKETGEVVEERPLSVDEKQMEI